MDVSPGHLLGQMGFRDVLESDERLIVEMDNRPDLTNTRGAIQGGLVATLIDIAAGRLAGRHVGPDQDVTTADMNVHFLAPVVVGPARAEATIVARGQANDRRRRRRQRYRPRPAGRAFDVELRRAGPPLNATRTWDR